MQDTKQKASESHLQKHDQEIEELRRKIDSMASIDTSNAGNIDGTALMMQINLLKEDLKIKAGPGELADLRQFVIDNVKESELKTNKSLDGIRHEIDDFRAEMGVHLGVINHKGELVLLVQVLSQHKVLEHLAHRQDIAELDTCAVWSNLVFVWLLLIKFWEWLIWSINCSCSSWSLLSSILRSSFLVGHLRSGSSAGRILSRVAP